MLTEPTWDVAEALRKLNADGYVVIENLLPNPTVSFLRDRVEEILAYERDHPVDPGDSAVTNDHVDEVDFEYWRSDDDEIARMKRRIRRRQADEFDTPWPVRADEVCISFIHIPSLFDDGRSQRIFNLINKDTAFAPLVEHPLLLAMMDQELGRDSIVLDMSVNHVGPHTNSAGWHVDSPLTQIEEPLPNFTLSIQSAWMLDDFTIDNGATHVVRGSHLTQRKPPSGRDLLENETVLEGPAGSVAVWLSQTWHRHGANVTDGVRNGVIIQYGRSWVKPFVDLRTPMTAEQAAVFSPRLRYMLGCNASAPVRG
ncbi:MAG: phytanoyl-CoA dioxygenase family protein [Ilumatobacteraceae bacterium]